VRVLVVEDDDRVAAALQAALVRHGMQVERVGQGLAVLPRLPDVDVVLLDLGLPDVDGLEVCRRIREAGDVPVIVVSARARVDERILGLHHGADDYVVKPFDIEELVARVGSALRRLKSMRDLSPLTGLPGNFRIAEELEKRITGGKPVAVVHGDLDNFKAYNDHYGFMRGDDVIKFTAATLAEAAVSTGDPTCFVGHVGGDDFIVVMAPAFAEQFCKEVTERFDDGILDFYDPVDALRGYVEVIDRRGERHAFPIVSFSMGVASNERRTFVSEWEASAVAAEMKEHAKSEPGSTYRVDRRTS
jgi:diguanylate cyclase (GGDEF)-like protein